MSDIRNRCLALILAAAASFGGVVHAQDAVPEPPAAPSAPAAQPAPPYAAPAPAYGAPPYYAPYYPQYPQYYAPYSRPGRPPIVGYQSEQRPTRALWASGLAMFLAGWVLDFAVVTPLANSISSERDDSLEQDAWAWSILPLAGPWIQLGLGAPHPAIPITMGILQAGGAAMIIAGLLMNETVRIPIYAGDPRAGRLDVTAGPGSVNLVYAHR